MSSATPGYSPQFGYGYSPQFGYDLNLRRVAEEKVDQSITWIKQSDPRLVNSHIKGLLEAGYAGLRDGAFTKEVFLGKIQAAFPKDSNIITTCSLLFGLDPASKIGYFYSSISHKFDKEGLKSPVLSTLISYYMDEQRPDMLPSELQNLLKAHQEEASREFKDLHLDAAQEQMLRHEQSPLDDYISMFMKGKEEFHLLTVPMRELLKSVSKLMQSSPDPQSIKRQFLLKFKAALTNDRSNSGQQLSASAEEEHDRWIKICTELAGFDLNKTVVGLYYDTHHYKWSKTSKPDTACNAFEEILGFRLYPWYCSTPMPEAFSKILKQHQDYSARLADPAAWAAANGLPPPPPPATAAAAAAGPAPDDFDWRASAGGSMSSASAARPTSSAAAAAAEPILDEAELDISHLLGPTPMSAPDLLSPVASASAVYENDSSLRPRGVPAAASASAAAAPALGGPPPMANAAPVANAPTPQPATGRPKGFLEKVWDTSAFFFSAVGNFLFSLWRAVSPWRS